MNVGLTKDLFQSLICFRLLHCFRWRLDQEKAQYVHHSTKKVDVCRNISTYLSCLRREIVEVQTFVANWVSSGTKQE